MKNLLKTSLWVSPAFISSFVFAKVTAIGPVVLVISDKRGWGVHAGDLGFLSSALIVTGIAFGAMKIFKKHEE